MLGSNLEANSVIAVYSGVTRQSSFGIRKYSSALAVVHVGISFVFTSPQSSIIVSFNSVVVPPW